MVYRSRDESGSGPGGGKYTSHTHATAGEVEVGCLMNRQWVRKRGGGKYTSRTCAIGRR